MSPRAHTTTSLKHAVTRRAPPVKADLHRQLQVLAHQIVDHVWKKLRDTRKFVRHLDEFSKVAGDTSSTVVAQLENDYYLKVIDKTDGSIALDTIVSVVQEVFDSLSAACPLVKEALESYSLMQLVLESGEYLTIGGDHCSAIANWRPDQATLYIAVNPAVGLTSGPLELGTGAHNVSLGFRTVLTHEIAHVAQVKIEQATGIVWAIEFDKQTPDYWRRTISSYAGNDSKEWFAEAFAAFTHPDYPICEHVLPDEVVAILESIGIEPGIRKGYFCKAVVDDNGNTTVTTSSGRVVSAAEVAAILQAVQDADWALIDGVMTPEMIDAFKQAGYQELVDIGVSAGESRDVFDVLDKEAVDYAKTRGAELVTQLQDTTRDRLRGTIVDALEEGWSKPELTDELIANFAFSEYRAEMIAHTEIAMAHSYGRVTTAKEAGAKQKRWLLSADHDPNEDCYCSDAADAGWVDIDENFVDDDDYDFPPGHPNCWCDWITDLNGTDDEEEDDGAEKLAKIHRPHKVKEGDKWKVVDTDGHVYGTHDSESEANAQLRALYANKQKSRDGQQAVDESQGQWREEGWDDEKVAEERQEYYQQELETQRALTDERNEQQWQEYKEGQHYQAQNGPVPDSARNSQTDSNIGKYSPDQPRSNDGRFEGEGEGEGEGSGHVTPEAWKQSGSGSKYSHAVFRNDDLQSEHTNHAQAERAVSRYVSMSRGKLNTSHFEIHARDTKKVVKADIDTRAHEAHTSHHSHKKPTDAQLRAGNYKMGHINVGGLDIAIENPAGSRRRSWYPVIRAHYGYANRTEGADGDHVDIFIKPGTPTDYDGPVYVINQPKADGTTFDEHKCMVGWYSQQGAIRTYLSAYQQGWKLGSVVKLTWDQFIDWLKNGDTTKPLVMRTPLN